MATLLLAEVANGHLADITFEPLFDLDAALAPRVGEIKR